MSDERATFDTDGEGRILVHPLTGWTVASIDSVGLLLQVEFALSKQEVESVAQHRMQLALTIEQALELADTILRRVGTMRSESTRFL